MKSREELIQERRWLQKNKSHPDYNSILETFNHEVDLYNAAVRSKNKTLKSAFKVGDIVTVSHEKFGGIYRVEKFLTKNILLSRMEGRRGNLRCCPSLMKKVEGEKKDLLDDLDLIGGL